MRAEKGYVVAVSNDSSFYIPDAEHIERNDDLNPWLYPDDASASQAAEADGIALIYGMAGVQDGVYIDSPENRQRIQTVLERQAYQERITQNHARSASDLPACARLLLKLETELGGESGMFGEWLRTAYELNEDFDDAPVEMVEKICMAFQMSKQQYGAEVARTLFNTQSVVLPTEIKEAARFLSMGGPQDSIPSLAHIGFFMGSSEHISHDEIQQAISFLEEGGTTDNIFNFLQQERNSAQTATELTMTGFCQG